MVTVTNATCDADQDGAGDICYDSTLNKWLVWHVTPGDSVELADISTVQTLTNKTIDATDGTNVLTIYDYDFLQAWKWTPGPIAASGVFDPYTDVSSTVDPTLYSTATNAREMQIRIFDEAASQTIITYWRVPDDFSGTTVKVRLHMIAHVGAWDDDEVISMDLYGGCGTDETDYGSMAFGTPTSVNDAPDNSIGQDDIHIFPASGWVTLTTTEVAGLGSAADFCMLVIMRDEDDAADTSTEAHGFIGMDIKYKRTLGAF
jgi:hypothetical protein